MIADELIRKHEKQIEVLEAIKIFQGKIDTLKHNINLVYVYFPALIERDKHMIIICKMCIKRLIERYEKLN